MQVASEDENLAVILVWETGNPSGELAGRGVCSKCKERPALDPIGSGPEPVSDRILRGGGQLAQRLRAGISQQE